MWTGRQEPSAVKEVRACIPVYLSHGGGPAAHTPCIQQKDATMGPGAGAVSKVHTLEVRGPEFDLQNPCRKLGAVACLCGPVIGEAATKASQSSLVGKPSVPVRNPVSEHKVNSGRGRKTLQVNLWAPYTHAHMYIHTTSHKLVHTHKRDESEGVFLGCCWPFAGWGGAGLGLQNHIWGSLLLKPMLAN